MKAMLKLSLVLAILLGLSACTKKQDLNEKVLNLSIPAEVKGYDPVYAEDMYSSNEIARIYEGLLEYHPFKIPYTLIPNLAESLPEVSKDGLTYTFKIKQGVVFQDDEAFAGGKGRELVAEDFVFSIKRLADPKLQSTGWWLFDGKIAGLNEWRDRNSKADKVNYDEQIEGLKSLDKYTLQFKLAKPYPQFLYSLAMTYTFAVAKEVVEKYGKEFLNHPVGTGAFKLPKFDQTKKITYTKNPTFRKKLYPSDGSEWFVKNGFLADAGKPLPLIEKLVINVMTEDQPRWLKFNKGELDVIGIPKDNFNFAIKNKTELSDELKAKGVVLEVKPNLDLTYVGFNFEHKIFQNLKLRRAMYLAYDDNKANELFYNNTAAEAHSIIPPGMAGYDESYKNPYKGSNIEAAKKMLAEAGYPEGKGLPEITYDAPDSSTSRQISEFFSKQMEQIGVKIKVVLTPWPEFTAKVKKKQVQMFGLAWAADYPDAENFLQLLYGPNGSPGSNSSNYKNAEFDKLFAKASLMQDSPERSALYNQLNKMVAEDVAMMYNTHRQSYAIMHGWLRNFTVSEFNAGQAQYLNIDLDKKKELIKKL